MVAEEESDEERLAEGGRFLTSILSEDDLGAIIRAHIFIEAKLLRLIEKGLAKPGAVKLTRVPFEVKVGLAIAVGSVPESLRSALLHVNALRNRLAHDIHKPVTEADALALFESLPRENREFMAGVPGDSVGGSLRSCLSFLYGRLNGLRRSPRPLPP